MEIKEIALKDIKPYKNNPRNNAGAVDAVAQSLQEFGAKVPIILDKDNIIVAGHTRLKAAKKLKLKTFPCVYADDLTPDQVKAFRLVDNKTAELAQWDFTKLENELKNITLDMSDYGFTVPELQPETHDDNFAEEAVEIPAVVKAGEIWQLGKHRLMCGDATSLADVQKLTRGGQIVLFCTDPPYGVDYSGKNEFLNKFGKGNHVQKDIENDALDAKESMETLWVPAFSNARACSMENATYYISSPGGELMLPVMQSIVKSGWQLKHVLIWLKNNIVLGRCDYNYKHEPILYGWNNKHKFYGNGEFTCSVWEIDKPVKNDLHPTMKPIKLIANCLLNSTQENDDVLDVFGGSGSTLIACEQLNRNCYMMELDPHYCDVIIKRWELTTGKKAERLNE